MPVQFNFNFKQKGVDKAIQKIQKGETASAFSELEKVKTEFDSRNKLIKLADKTEHPYNRRSAPETAPNPYSHNFRRFSVMRQQSTYGSARPTDICRYALAAESTATGDAIVRAIERQLQTKTLDNRQFSGDLCGVDRGKVYWPYKVVFIFEQIYLFEYEFGKCKFRTGEVFLIFLIFSSVLGAGSECDHWVVSYHRPSMVVLSIISLSFWFDSELFECFIVFIVFVCVVTTSDKNTGQQIV